MDEIGRRLLGGYDVDDARIREIMRACETYEIEYLLQHGGCPYPGVREVLEELSRKYFLAIVSNCQKGYIEAFLDYYQLNEYISDKESFGGTGLPKGENIRLVCERNHLERAVYLGDIEGDYRSALHGRNSLYPCGLWFRYDLRSCSCDLFPAGAAGSGR